MKAYNSYSLMHGKFTCYKPNKQLKKCLKNNYTLTYSNTTSKLSYILVL